MTKKGSLTDFNDNIVRILEFHVKENMAFIMLPIPPSKYVGADKTNSLNAIIDDLSYVKVKLNYSTWDLSHDGLHLTKNCIREKLPIIKLAINNTILEMAQDH